MTHGTGGGRHNADRRNAMRDFNEYTATAAVLDRMSGAKDARFKEVMSSVVRHLHAVVREVEPTMDEWMAAIQFLTATGQKCDDKRQEFILLSDTLGVSMLVDAINNRKPSGATESTVLGPFHVAGAPKKDMGDTISLDGRGEPAWVEGRVVDQDGKPIGGALLDVWQTSSDGAYDIQDPNQPPMNLRGLFTTGADGRFFFRTVKPSSYPIPTDGPVGGMLMAMGRHPMRPAHIHFIVGAAGHEPVTTHIFVEGDEYLDSDAVFGVKESLIEPFALVYDPAEAKKRGLANPFYRAKHDFTLVKQARS
jgi:catechol 1,2-dioxygenase